MSGTKHISFRVAPDYANWIKKMAERYDTTQAEILKKCVDEVKGKEGSVLKDNVIQKATKFNKGGSVTNDDMQILKQLGISTASGIAGYYISGWIREQMKLDEDKGTQVLLGLMVGLGTQILQTYLQHQKK